MNVFLPETQQQWKKNSRMKVDVIFFSLFLYSFGNSKYCCSFYVKIFSFTAVFRKQSSRDAMLQALPWI